jgi:broad specificity phosphatase PhoE
MQLYIIRHGQSTNNALTDDRERVCDAPLTGLGRRQAKRVTQHLAAETRLVPWEADSSNPRGYNITRLYCSPMWRALQTAQPIGQALSLAPRVWIDLHEYGGIYLDHGEAGGIVGYPGKTRSEILAQFPNYVLPEGITEQGWWHQEHEDRSACQARAIRVAQELQKWADCDERIALVTHGSFMADLLKALLNGLPNRRVHYHHYNTAISRIDFRSGGHIHVRYLNRVDHIPRELIS